MHEFKLFHRILYGSGRKKNTRIHLHQFIICVIRYIRFFLLYKINWTEKLDITHVRRGAYSPSPHTHKSLSITFSQKLYPSQVCIITHRIKKKRKFFLKLDYTRFRIFFPTYVKFNISYQTYLSAYLILGAR